MLELLRIALPLAKEAINGFRYGKNKMKNGCPDCEKLSDDKLCDYCELDMLMATAHAAIGAYLDKSRKIMEKIKSEIEGKPNGKSKG